MTMTRSVAARLARGTGLMVVCVPVLMLPVFEPSTRRRQRRLPSLLALRDRAAAFEFGPQGVAGCGSGPRRSRT